MNNLFERAKQIGLAYITQWLPNGKREGDEWSAINPTRADNKIGSFKVNLKTGKWMDGATGDKGCDAVSLYAYLHEDKLSFQAMKYKNSVKGIQTEAAKEILLNYDNTYFPGKDDDFTPTQNKSKGDFWDGFSPYSCKKGESYPDFDPTFFERHWGKFSGDWDFYSGGKFIMKVCRFIDDTGKKSDRPFTAWTNGQIKKLRSKRPIGKYPI